VIGSGCGDGSNACGAETVSGGSENEICHVYDARETVLDKVIV
jgi:hypothetical protein